MKKALPVLLFLFVFSISLVSALDLASGLGHGMNQLIDIIEELIYPVFSVFFGGDDGFMFEKVLLLAIILSVTYLIISNIEPFKDNDKVIWIVSISIALLTTRFMTADLVSAIILPYSVFGVALTAILPLMIFFTFVSKFESAVMRKVFWIFFIIVFLGIWNSRYDQLGGVSWIYFFSAIAALVFLIWDGTIQHYLTKQEAKRQNVDNIEEAATRIRKKMDETNEALTKGYMNEKRHRSVIKKLEKQLKRIYKSRY